MSKPPDTYFLLSPSGGEIFLTNTKVPHLGPIFRALSKKTIENFWGHTVVSLFSLPKSMAEGLKTPQKVGRPKKKRDRPSPIEGLEGRGDLNDFVRGSIWTLHTQGKSSRDIASSVRAAPSSVSAVISECKRGDFLRVPAEEWGS